MKDFSLSEKMVWMRLEQQWARKGNPYNRYYPLRFWDIALWCILCLASIAIPIVMVFW